MQKLDQSYFDDRVIRQHWEDLGGVTHRLSGRFLMGGAVLNDGQSTNTAGDWLEPLMPASTYTAQHVVLSSIGQISILGGSRSSDFPFSGSMGCIGIMGAAINDNASEVQSVYGSYIEAQRSVGTGTTHGQEIDIVNFGDLIPITPYANFNMGLTAGSWIASGGGKAGATVVSAAEVITNNGAQFASGLVVKDGAIVPDADGKKPTISIPINSAIDWHDLTGIKFRIVADDTKLEVLDANGNALLSLTQDGIAFGSLTMTPGGASDGVVTFKVPTGETCRVGVDVN